jgi:DNA-binding HxlR family transcriptional regulator
MAENKRNSSSSEHTMRCPVGYALEMFGDRWSLLLIRDMLVRGKRRYSEFLNSEEGISTNILAARLKQMQKRGLIDKFPDPKDGKASIYLLTDKGVRLTPILMEIIRWGLENDQYSSVPDRIAKALTQPNQAFTSDILKTIQAERGQLQ